MKTISFATIGLASAILIGAAFTAETDKSILASADTGVVVISGLKDGTYLFRVSGTSVTITPATVINLDGPTPPVVVVPDDPTDSFRALARKNLPNHINRDQDRRAMAFGMEFLKQAVANVEVSKARQTVREFCNAAVAPNQANWSAWWAAIDTKLNSTNLTSQSYQAALSEIAQGLTEDLSDSSSLDSDGQKTFGLSPEIVEMLMKVLLPLLLKLLGVG